MVLGGASASKRNNNPLPAINTRGIKIGVLSYKGLAGGETLEGITCNRKISIPKSGSKRNICLKKLTRTGTIDGDKHQLLRRESGRRGDGVDPRELRGVGAQQSRDCGNRVKGKARPEGEERLASPIGGVAEVTQVTSGIVGVVTVFGGRSHVRLLRNDGGEETEQGGDEEMEVEGTHSGGRRRNWRNSRFGGTGGYTYIWGRGQNWLQRKIKQRVKLKIPISQCCHCFYNCDGALTVEKGDEVDIFQTSRLVYCFV